MVWVSGERSPTRKYVGGAWRSPLRNAKNPTVSPLMPTGARGGSLDAVSAARDY
jgi:hypothetical protein